jgi:hypothetical protein
MRLTNLLYVYSIFIMNHSSLFTIYPLSLLRFMHYDERKYPKNTLE